MKTRIWKDPIVEEVRAIRAQLVREAGGTLDGLIKLVKSESRKRENGRTPKRQPLSKAKSK